MNMRIKKWCPKDIKRLTVLYYMGATDQEISPILRRSIQSIGKKITRLRIRPLNSKSHILTPGRHLPKEMSPVDLSQLVDQELKTLEKASSFISLLLKRYPLHKKKKSCGKSVTPLATLQEETSQWRSLKDISHFIQERRHRVTEKNCARTGATHLINGQKKGPLDLLMIANTMRLRESKPIFFLEKHTQY